MTRVRGRPEIELGADGRQVSMLGATIRAWRSHLHLSASELAERAGLGESGRSYISQLEHGHIRQASDERLHRIAAVFGLTMHDLLEHKLPMRASSGKHPRLKPAERAQALLVDEELAEYTNPRLETRTTVSLQEQLAEYKVAILGIYDVPAEPVIMRINGIDWEVSVLANGEYFIPPSVYTRIRELEKAGITFGWLLWAEEELSTNDEYTKNSMLIGVVRTDKGHGIWCLLGKWLH